MLVAGRTTGGYRLAAAMIDSILVATDRSETGGKVASGGAVDPEVSQWHFASDARADSILDAACAALRLLESRPFSRRARRGGR
jgi:hypothetical protein